MSGKRLCRCESLLHHGSYQVWRSVGYSGRGSCAEKAGCGGTEVECSGRTENKAAACESQGEVCRQSGDLWGAKSQYLSAKSIYQELGSDEDVQRIEGILSDIDAQIGQMAG